MHRIVLLLVLGFVLDLPAQDDYQPGPDSIVQPNVAKGELIKGTYSAEQGSVFPGTERDYTIYLPPRNDDTPVVEKNHDKSVVAPSPFMIFQDGVIYNAPVVFDNLIAKKEIPPLIGIFIKPGVVPAVNENALPRDNRSYEYDSVTDTYARFLNDEFLPAIEKKHSLKLSSDPNDAAIAGNSSGGICAFMAAWHRPDRIRRVFSGVGTYVGIRGGDQLPVLVRKYEPKPLRVYLQSGEHDNNIYCGDWWMANQMMERSLTWAGYDVNHTWGTGGHSANHATAIFPEVMRWLWRDYNTAKEIKANPRGESKWVGYKVLGDGKWEQVMLPERSQDTLWREVRRITPKRTGEVLVTRESENVTDRFEVRVIQTSGSSDHVLLWQPGHTRHVTALAAGGNDTIQYWMRSLDNPGIEETFNSIDSNEKTVTTKNGWLYVATALGIQVCDTAGRVNFIIPTPEQHHDVCFGGKDLGELFIACRNKIYKRPTKAHGIVSGQQPPIKPVPRKP